MQGNQPDNVPRVHVRALARLQQLHEEISSGHCPSIQDLAVSTGRTSRTLGGRPKLPQHAGSVGEAHANFCAGPRSTDHRASRGHERAGRT